MSYILNALRKSELERQDTHVETLEDRLQDRQTNDPKKSSFWIITLVLVNLLLLSFFIWSFTKEKDQPSKAEVVDVPKQEQSISTKVRSAITRPTSISKKVETSNTRSISEQIKRQKTKNFRVKKEPKTSEIKPKIQPMTAAEPPLETETIIPENNIIDEQNDDFPFLSELDYDFRRKIPNIDINVYVYADKEQDRFIMIAMKKYQSGQKIGSDMTLKEIRMNSLVIEYKNRIFQIKRK